MKHLLIVISLLVTLTLQAQIEQKVSSQISQVTVYTRGAQVTRNASPTVAQGTTELVFTGISPRLDKQSIQVKGDGAFTIVSVSHKMNYFKHQEVSDEIAQLAKKQIDFTDEYNQLNALLNVYKSEQTLIEKNQSIGGANTGVTAENLKAVADFQRIRLTEIFNKQLEISKEMAAISIEQQRIIQQLSTLNKNIETPTAEIHVMVSAKAAVNSKFEISYYILDAGWFANYDFRVENINKPVSIFYKANVYQTSGEDWKNVKLTLSNGNPNESGVAPKLYPWRLHYGAKSSYAYDLNGFVNNSILQVSGKVTDQSGEPVPFATVVVKGSTLGTITDLEGNYNLKLSPGANYLIVSYVGYQSIESPINNNKINIQLRQETNMLEEVVITQAGVKSTAISKASISNYEKAERKTIALETNFQYKPTTFSYTVVDPYTILNDGKVLTLDIQDYALDATYMYYAAPKIDRDAFLTALITDWQELNLLTGEANLFFEGTYLGKTILDPTFASDTLQLSLGRDKAIQIQRNKVKEFTQRQFLGGNKVETTAYEIKIRNNKQQNIHIIIEDQFPISSESGIQVDGTASEGGKVNGDTQIITWDLNIPSGAEEKLDLKYTVKYPKDKVVVLE